jgi:hypothetical protein
MWTTKESRLRRPIALIAVLTCLALAGAGAWQARAVRLAPFILPDATQLSILQPGLNTIVITYHADPGTWRQRLSQQLRQAGWSVHTYENPGATLPQWAFVSWYTRDTIIGPLALHEHALFVVDRNDPTDVHLQITREVVWLAARGLNGRDL